MDRQIVYVGAIPQDTDLLLTNKNTLIGLGMLIQAVLGTSTVCDGLACTPTSPGTLDVLLGPGSLYEYENVDATAYGSLADDTTHQIMKQGINLGTLTLSCPAPTTTGYSINYLIEVNYQDNDTGSTVLPYYNASNPAVAYNGPNNTGVSQNTIRQGELVVTVKPGTAATTGTQTTPPPDAGFTGIWVVTVAYGQTAITSGNIAKYSGAPFINYKLPQLAPAVSSPRSALTSNTTYYVATTGNDSTGNGTSALPWQTRQHAYNYICENIDCAGFGVTIQLADGTYTDGFNATIAPIPSNTPITFNGDAGTPANVIINPSSGDGFTFNGAGINATVQNMVVENTGDYGNGITTINQARCTIGVGVTFGAVASSKTHLNANIDGTIYCPNSYGISGGGQFHWGSNEGGSIVVSSGITITLSGTPAFTGAFANANQGSSTIACSGITFSGSATGSYFSVANGGVINTNGGGANYLPGNTAGIGTNFGTSPYGLYV